MTNTNRFWKNLKFSISKENGKVNLSVEKKHPQTNAVTVVPPQPVVPKKDPWTVDEIVFLSVVAFAVIAFSTILGLKIRKSYRYAPTNIRR